MAQRFAVAYKFTPQKVVSVGFARNFSNWGRKLDNSQLVLGYEHNGFDFKIPIATYNQADNRDGLLLSTALTLAAHGAVYYALHKYHKSIDKEKVERYFLQFSRYE